MIGRYRVTALIPARGGSKRLPGKNIKNFCGKPLIAWTIDETQKSKYIDSVIVSTDDLNIKKVAEKFGASVPFLRPDILSSDTASSFEVIQHTIDMLKINDTNDLIILLQPTSPLRTINEIDSALEFFLEKGAKGVVSVSECEHSPLWSNNLPDSGSMENFIREDAKGKRSQELPTFYRLNGSIYIYKVIDVMEKNQIFFDENVYAFKTSTIDSIDIDTELDFLIAEIILKNKLR